MFRMFGFVFFLLQFIAMDAAAQTVQKGDLSAFVDSLISAMPSGIGTNDYHSPSPAQRQSFSAAAEYCLKGNLSSASASAAAFGYRCITFTDTVTAVNRQYIILLRGRDSSNHWGTFIFNPAAQRTRLVIQSPHELFDTKTGPQGAYVFQGLSARAFFLNGAHRCNNSESSSCSGTTTACGASGPFKISDQAHTDIGTFQLATAVLLQYRNDAVVVQLHGFGKSAGDPDLIMGNGTAAAPAGPDHVTALKNALLMIDPSLTFKIAHVDTAWTDLTGTTNTQGRLVNNSANPCSVKPAAANGRFLHIEQAYSGLRDTKTSWKKMSDALGTVFPADPLSVNEQDEDFPKAFTLFECYPNPFNPSTTVRFTLQVSGLTTLKIYDALGREVSTLVNENLEAGLYHQRTFDASHLATGNYFARLTSGGISQMKKIVLMK
ncbi:MAG: T9SS type A sorting domain-containing protein [Bacteroidota bacterium]